MSSSRAQKKLANGDAESAKRVSKSVVKTPLKFYGIEWNNTKSFEELEAEMGDLTEEEKQAHLKKHYASLFHMLKRSEESQKELLVQLETAECSKSELTKNVTLRQKLENVCRELQNQNKKLKEEYTEKLRNEEERRRSTAHQFQLRLQDLTKLLEESKIQSEQAHKDNSNMGRRLKELCKQFQQREAQLTAKAQASENARKQFDTELDKILHQRKGEQLLHQKEIETLNLKLATSEQECLILREATKSMQKHLDEYNNRYAEIETNLARSTQMFEKCKNDMMTMTDHLRAIEGENVQMKIQMAEQYKTITSANDVAKKQDANIKSLKKRCDQLDKLCRQVQTDRANYLKLLRAHNIQIGLPKNEQQHVEAAPVQEPNPSVDNAEKQAV